MLPERKMMTSKQCVMWLLAVMIFFASASLSKAQEPSDSPSPTEESPLQIAERVAHDDAAQAINIATKVLVEAEAGGNAAQQAAALRVLAIANYFEADFPRALERATAAESLYRELGDRERQASVLSLMGAIHGSSKQYERALRVYQRALAVSRESDNRSGEAIVLMNLGKSHYDLGDYDEAVRRYEQSIQRFDTATAAGERVRPDAMLFAKMGIADALLRLERPTEAITRADAVLSASDPDSLTYQNALSILGESHLELGELTQADTYLNKAYDEANRTQRPKRQAGSLTLLARLAEARGDYQRALDIQRAVNALNLDIYNERNSEELARLEARYDSDLRDQQIAVQGLQLRQNRSTIIAIGAVAAAALLVALILLQLYRVKRRSLRTLKVLAETDPLTGLLNRRTMYEFLRHIDERPGEQKAHSLCLLDIDDFKKINDQYGHAAGDASLVRIAKSLSANLRGTDRIARWGGEEFLILLSERTPEEAAIVAERLCTVVSELVVDLQDGGTVNVTASIGLAHVYNARSGDVVQRADAAMYQAKLNGKNRIATYDHERDEIAAPLAV